MKARMRSQNSTANKQCPTISKGVNFLLFTPVALEEVIKTKRIQGHKGPSVSDVMAHFFDLNLLVELVSNLL